MDYSLNGTFSRRFSVSHTADISLLFFHDQLLNQPPRQLWKDDAIPTLFDYNKDKQP